ncbi:DUF2612 domain-containing protein [Bordetella hinzii]|uniref:PF11041 family protein n=1 Tax=Bordetella hinzii OH87 BAL007II TaxID=1331262 RepID=A0ABR4R3Q6_9BORD|nr:DUF2612 domain-containing protein [Bordetella hinzii]KCB24850.1 PF11041 family protein [Bordetella hinzii OH87 BAL007II]QDJ43788.1 hypothetical protein CBR70_22170 [Bordetella hinzii]QDJ52798.1 hypothetical protein CBR69_22005 [Bordetella hinzii]
MDLEQDHAEIAWGHWPGQFQGAPRLEALVKALLKPAQGLQGALRALYEDRWLETAVGKQLDGIGEIVGLPRVIDEAIYVRFFGFQGQPNVSGFGEARFRRTNERPVAGSATLLDPEYRKLLYWKIALNNGHGTIPEISRSLKPIFDVDRVIVQNVGNAKIRIWVSRIPGPNDPLMANPYKWVPQAAGVGVQLITGSTEKPFGFREQGFYGFGVGVLARGIY